VSGISQGGGYGTYTDPEFPGVVYRVPGPTPEGKRWKPVKIFGTRSQRKMTDLEMRRSGLHTRGEMHQFDENPEGKDFIVRQRLVDIEPQATNETAAEPVATTQPAPAATGPAPAVPAPAPAPVPQPTAAASIQPSTAITPIDTPQFGQTSALVAQQRALDQRASPLSRRPRRPLLTGASNQDTLGAFPT